MSDSEAPGAPAGSDEVVPEPSPVTPDAGSDEVVPQPSPVTPDTGSDEVVPQPSPVTPDANPPQTPDVTLGEVAADIAPSRKTRRRPETKPPVEVQEETQAKPNAEEETATPSESTVAQGSWGYWGSWGKSLLSTATATVATVGQGITQAIEKAETSLGIPSPTELSARAGPEGRAQGEASAEADQAEGDGSESAVGSAMGMLSSLSSVVQSTGKTVLSGGLDALEFLGKKTMDVIAEGDPGFKKTKGLMIRSSTLSQVLREAKEREEQQTEVACATEKKAHYGMLFDGFQGLAHLEALEILSRESEAKVKSVLTTLSGEELAQLRRDLELIKEPFSLVEFDDDEVDEKKDEDGSEFLRELTEALNGLRLSTTADKLGKASRGACEQIAEMTKLVEVEEEEGQKEDETKPYTVEDVHSAAIRSLAELTARSIEQFHKVAEMILFSDSQEVATLEQARILAQITIVLCKEVSLQSKKFTSALTTIGATKGGDVLNPLITGVFLEASNSASYIQDAFQLLMPVLEVTHIQSGTDSAQP